MDGRAAEALTSRFSIDKLPTILCLSACFRGFSFEISLWKKQAFAPTFVIYETKQSTDELKDDKFVFVVDYFKYDVLKI